MGVNKKIGETNQQLHQPTTDNREENDTTCHAQSEKELSTSAFFLAGVQHLKQFHGLHPQAEPSAVVGETLGLL